MAEQWSGGAGPVSVLEQVWGYSSEDWITMPIKHFLSPSHLVWRSGGEFREVEEGHSELKC